MLASPSPSAAPSDSLCPACARSGHSRWRPASPSDPSLNDEFWLTRCPHCGTASTRPLQDPATLAPLYASGFYSPPHPLLDRLIEPIRQIMLRERDRSLDGVAAGAKLFEIGAGDGSYIAHLRGEGYRATGIEPHARPGDDAIERIPLDQVELPARSQDVVMMWHVLEHLDDPAAALAAAHEWLVLGGRLIVAVPNISSVQARIGEDRWFHQDVPRHRTHFAESGLLRLLERQGFGPRRVRHVLLEHNPLGMWQTLLNRLTDRRDVAFRMLKRDPTLRGPGIGRDLLITLLVGPILVPVALILELFAGLTQRGGTIIVEATRTGR
ncbi:MAG: class I SAM-dependent methyltransferase [Thermoleophilia bacterium]|nr:class I SAM-dependent methyltransferase [Thermoleophilia bacterium]